MHLALALLIAAPSAAQGASGERRLELAAPIETWDEALPLGNGLMGGLLWGDGNAIRLSLDRGDLWDERLPALYLEEDWNWAKIRRLVAAGDQGEVSRLFDAPYHEAAPTKLPGGRLELTLDPSQQAQGFRLDLDQALATVELSEGGLECFFDALHPVALLRVSGPAPSYRFLRPAGLDALGYEPALFGEEGDTTWMVQEAALGLTYAVVVSARRSAGETLIAVAITSNRDDRDPLALGRRRVAEALERGWPAARSAHLSWWRDFWATSSVHIPDAPLQRHYDLVKYFYGAASRSGSPPMPLQGVWTRDDGGLPPWKGDYHHDLNTQMTYLAYHPAGLLDAGRSFLDHNWDLLPTYRDFARDFYGVRGAAMPGVSTLAGRPTGGWSQYALSPTNALWVGHSYYLHWRHTMDAAFLAERAYPWLAEMAAGVAELLEERDGGLYLPLSTSPEIHNNSLAAWLTPNSNYDQDLVRWAFGACAEMAAALDLGDEEAFWRRLASKLPAAHVADDGVLMFAAGEPFDESHRHHSHTMAIHPLGTLNVEGSAGDRAVIDATLDRMHELGTQAWVGYSFSWFACLLARAGRADEALHYLRDFERAFILRNGFHVNGDQIGAGLSGFSYRPFTLEGNFLAMEAVHEMLLQSWGGRVRVFPAVPTAWEEVSFERLRAQGGFSVSAERKDGRTRRVSVTAAVAGTLRLQDPFDGEPFESSRPVTRRDGEFRVELAAGESLELLATVVPERQAQGTLYLVGEWQVRLDPEDVGLGERWFAAPIEGSPMRLPGTTDLAGLGHALDEESMTYPVDFPGSQWPGRGPVQRLDEAGHLLRRHMYLGKAWYQRTIDVPEDYAGRHMELFLERVTWASEVWLDGVHIGGDDSLVAPHRFDLGALSPGPHRLTIRVDNGPVHDIGTIGHAYGPETQSRWNGIVGRMGLMVGSAVRLNDLQVYPAPDRSSVRVRYRIDNHTGRARTANVQFHVYGNDGELGSVQVRDLALSPSSEVLEARVELRQAAPGWNEFTPELCSLLAKLDSDGERDFTSVDFGFRHLERAGRHILNDGERVFLRGTLDCCVYPRTGHPPTTVQEWGTVLGTIQEYGFNHVRFHTWCPPEAAFIAADQLGIYLAPETPFWVDNWTAQIGAQPELLGARDDVTDYVRREMRRISEAYGNHPSFAFFCIGNEFGMSSDWELVNRVLSEAKEADPRRLYNATTARRRVAADDFWVTHRTDRPVRGLGPNHTDWDFSAAIAAVDLPVVSHETGQRPVFPDYEDLLPKFDGPLLPKNYERLRERLVAAGLAEQVPAFECTSALFQNVQYKAEHEALHRTPDLAGYQLLMLNDFTGQSEALVGILDPFWESKGIVHSWEVRRWNAPSVLLARFARPTWCAGETFSAAIEISHFGFKDLRQSCASWSLTTSSGRVLAEGELPPTDIPRGGLTSLGTIEVPLTAVQEATAVDFRVVLPAETIVNSWKLWFYPPPAPRERPSQVLVAHAFDDDVRTALAMGERVLLLAHGTENEHAKRTGYASVYWSAGWWGDAFSSLGILCDPRHPALAAFPNDGHSDAQWYELTEGATTFLLEGAPPGYRPIVQPVTDFHHTRRLGQLFETRVGAGRLLVCGYDLERDLDTRHAARQFRSSLLTYVGGTDFEPEAEVDLDLLERWLRRPTPAPTVAVDAALFESARLHLRAAGRLTTSNTDVPWVRASDEVVRRETAYTWHVRGGTWRDATGVAWHGNPLEVTIELPSGESGTLLLHLHDWNGLGRRGTLTLDGRTYTLGEHSGEGVWLALPLDAADTSDGRLELRAEPSAGPNLMITELALLPGA